MGPSGIEGKIMSEYLKCIVQWIDSKGTPTPDTNDAVCLVQPFDPKRLNPKTNKFEVPEDFDFEKEVNKYRRTDGDVIVPEIGYGLPCCEEHLARAGVFWRALPLPNQPEKEWHERVRHQAPAAVLQTIIRTYPGHCEEILKELKHDALCNYWFFNRWGMHVGVEKDGYIHS